MFQINQGGWKGEHIFIWSIAKVINEFGPSLVKILDNPAIFENTIIDCACSNIYEQKVWVISREKKEGELRCKIGDEREREKEREGRHFSSV